MRFTSSLLAALSLAHPASAQVTAWVSTHGQADFEDLALDPAGNVVSTGHRDTGTYDDYVTVKHDADGNLQWVATYDGPPSWNDRARAVAVDGAGNVVVTGESSFQSNDCVTIKYDANGQEQWVARSAGPAGTIRVGMDVDVDAVGNVYVTGFYLNAANFEDGYLTIKYDPQGNEQWTTLFEGPTYTGSGAERATALAVDAAGNVVVTGNSTGVGTGPDFVTIRYDTSGQQQWLARYIGPGPSSEFASAIALDDQGHVYVTGSSAYTFATVEYDAQGIELWATQAGFAYGFPLSLAVDDAGAVVVTGNRLVSGDYRGTTIRYDGGGHEQWETLHERLVNAVAVDADGHAYVTGSDEASKLDGATGAVMWITPHAGFGGSTPIMRAVALDAAGDVFMAGDGATVRLSPFGFQSYGDATGGTSGLAPELAATGGAKIGTAGSLEITNGLGGAAGLLLLGAGFGSQADAPALGGTRLVEPAIVLPITLGGIAGAPGAGSLSVPFLIPNDATLVGENVNLQALFVDPGGPEGASMTNGLAVWIG